MYVLCSLTTSYRSRKAILMSVIVTTIIFLISLFVARQKYYSFSKGDRKQNKQVWISSLSYGAITFLLISYAFGWFVEISASRIWWNSVSYLQVYDTKLSYEALLFVSAFLISFVVLFAALTAYMHISGTILEIYHIWLKRWSIVIFSLFMAHLAQSQSANLMMFINSISFGHTDPIFNKDISLYVFQYPWLNSVFTLASILFGIVIFLSFIFFFVMNIEPEKFNVINVLEHLFYFYLILGLWFLLYAWEKWIDQTKLVISGTSGVIQSASNIDLHYKIALDGFGVYAYTAIGIGFIFLGIGCITKILWSDRRENTKIEKAVNIGLLYVLIVGLFGLLVYVTVPGIIWNFYVRPNEMETEKPFIQATIDETYWGYDLAKTDLIKTTYNNFSRDEFRANESILSSAPIFAYGDVLRQLNESQAVTPYYKFTDADLFFNSQEMAIGAVRSIDQSKLPANSWQNTRQININSFGHVLIDVNKSDQDGLVNLLDSMIDDDHVREQLYFGEGFDWAIVPPTTPFGIELNWQNRFLFSVWLDDMNILNSIVPEGSKLVLKRNVVDILSSVLPFVEWDSDLYFMINSDNEIVWIVNGFTSINNVPYSQNNRFIRQGFVATVSANNGEMHVYQMDDNPIIDLWSKTYSLDFEKLEQMPDDIQNQLRYPEKLFRLQTEILARYHLVQTNDWYSNADGWRISEGIEPTFVKVKLPNDNKNTIMLTTSYSARDSININAIVLVAPDRKLRIFSFPNNMEAVGTLPAQFAIDQSQQLNNLIENWRGKGIDPFWGNSIIVPLFDVNSVANIVVMKPLFAQNRLVKIVIFANGKIIIGDNLPGALEQLYTGIVSTDNQLNLARQRYLDAKNCYQSGSFTCFGEKFDLLGEILDPHE